MSPNWRDPSYLQHGTPRQQAAYAALQELEVFSLLAEFRPVLTGTIPLGIDLPESDLDLVCQAADLQQFAARLRALYGRRPEFRLRRKSIRGRASVIARLQAGGFPVEIFAQRLPIEQQHAYRHMRIEHHLLESGGPPARAAILALRRKGLKTEPAFARYFGLEGDPFAALLALEARLKGK